jgi:hypothetical protein
MEMACRQAHYELIARRHCYSVSSAAEYFEGILIRLFKPISNVKRYEDLDQVLVELLWEQMQKERLPREAPRAVSMPPLYSSSHLNSKKYASHPIRPISEA